MSSTKFRNIVWDHYKKHGRHDLPWRLTRDPYKILVSEIMLQQTQATRVVPKYEGFLRKFPTIHSLARSSLAKVLREWQGLGYNRRAKFLHETAKAIVTEHAGALPRSHSELVGLPGIGTYTASAVRAFAWNEPDIFIETNIRTVFIKHFFPHSRKVPDSKILPLIKETLDRRNSREWYAALMDYGAHLKLAEGNASLCSAHHTRQKPFKGSDREIRGAILKMLSEKSYRQNELLRALPFPAARVDAQLAALIREGMIVVLEGKVVLSD